MPGLIDIIPFNLCKTLNIVFRFKQFKFIAGKINVKVNVKGKEIAFAVVNML